MPTLELKMKLLEKIENIDQEYLLEQLLQIIEFETSEIIHDIPKAHLKSIEKGLEQINSADFLTNDEVIKRIHQWGEQ